MNKKFIFPLLILLVTCCAFSGDRKSYKYPYQNPALPVEQRVKDLISRMTMDEKIMQLDMFWGKEITDMKGHEATSFSEEKTKQVIGTTGIGSVHDLYPLNSSIVNSIQKYALEKTRLGIPVLFIEEGLH